MQLLFPILFFGAMWFLLIRPQQQRVRAQRALLGALEPGDEVVAAGAFGTVRRVDGDRVAVEIAPGVVVSYVLPAITKRIAPTEDGA